MSRPYNPKYDSVLGPMREPSPPPSSENPFSHDASFLSQLDPSRVDVADTEAALTHLFGDVVNQAQQDDHTTSQAEDGVNKQEMQIGLTDHQLQAEQSTPTLANQEVTTTESLPLSTPEGGESDANHILIDPSLADSETGSAEPTSLPGVPVKRKATSRANMLARGGACEFCKKRKLKCSAEVPSCSNCSKVGKECVYSQKKQRSRVRVLEDRLQELEKRLDPKNTTSNTANESPIQQVNITSNNNSTTNGNTDSTYDPTDYPTLSTFEFDHHLEDPSNANPVGVDLGLEPDLMTLADAAAADTSVEYQSWQGLSPELIVGEIIKAVSGGSVPGSDGKSVGEKIVSHLIQLYIGPPSLPVLHPAVSPTTLLSRLTNRHRPIHPSLLLSLIPFLLPLSPSQILHSPSIPLLIQTHAKGLISNAITNSDPRIIDIIAACTIRAYGFYEQARYFEGWTESASATSMVYAAGLHKLGRVGEKFISQVNIEGRTERVDREKKLRVILGKGVAVSPPIDRVELGERINLFWFAYANDRGGAAGWGWPSSFNDEEITTPWPRDDYDNDEALLDNRTITDFMDTTAPSHDDGSKDTLHAAHCKAITLFYHANRLFDMPSRLATPERTSRLIRLTKRYMSTSIPVRADEGIERSPRNEIRMTLHAVMCVLHAKEEIDAPPGSEREYFDKSIESTGKALEIIQNMQMDGNVDLDGLEITSAMLFHFFGRLMTKYLHKITPTNLQEWQGETLNNEKDIEVINDLLRKKEGFSNALETLGKRMKFANISCRLLDNIAYGSDFKMGEYERPDNMP